MTLSPPKRQTGFSLVELLVAILVGAILVSSVNSVINSHTYLAQRTQNLVFTNAYAEGKVESLRSRGYNSLSNGTSDISDELPVELSAPKSGSMTISDHTAGIKKVVLSITYNDLGANRTYQYTSLVGELGVGQY